MLRNEDNKNMFVDLHGTCVTYDAGNEGRYYCMFAECLPRDLYRIVHLLPSSEYQDDVTFYDVRD